MKNEKNTILSIKSDFKPFQIFYSNSREKSVFVEKNPVENLNIENMLNIKKVFMCMANGLTK